MKALSLRQPYAHLIVIGEKTIELRSWNTKHRGEFLIHAAKTVNVRDITSAGFNPKFLDFGAIIGKAQLIEVKNYEDFEEDEWIKDQKKHLAGPAFRSSLKGFILKNAVQFKKPIPYKGQLNFFEVPNEILEKCFD